MRKIILLLSILHCVVYSTELKNEDVDNSIRWILFENPDPFEDPTHQEMIKGYQGETGISDLLVESSLCRILQDEDDCPFKTRILRERVLYCLGDYGTESSISTVEKFITDSNPLWEVSRGAINTCIILSGHDFQRIKDYIDICVNENEKFWTSSLLNRLLRAYKDEADKELKSHIGEVIRKTIKLLEEYKYADWVPERLEEYNMTWIVNTENSSSKERSPSTPKLNETAETRNIQNKDKAVKVSENAQASQGSFGEKGYGHSWLIYLLVICGTLGAIKLTKGRKQQ